MKFWQKIFALFVTFVILSACVTFLPPARSGGAPQLPVVSPSTQETAQSTSTTPTSTPRPTRSPIQTREPAEKPSEQYKTLLDEYLPRRVVLAETDHFIFYAQDDYFPVDLERWKKQAEEIYAYVSDRVMADSPVKISVAFLPAQKTICPIRGLASSDDPPTIILFADPGVAEDYLKGVLSHEVGHAIPAQGFEGGLPNDISLTEGLASWASGKYWDAWMGTPGIHYLVRQYIDSGKYLPLAANVDLPGVYPWQEGAGADCLARRDQVYSQWASFIDFLLQRYGWAKVHQLFESASTAKKGGQEMKHPTDYQGIVGKSLEQLESEWLEFVMRVTTIKRRVSAPFFEAVPRWSSPPNSESHSLEHKKAW